MAAVLEKRQTSEKGGVIEDLFVNKYLVKRR